VKTEKSAIQDGIKNEVFAVRNYTEDSIEKCINAVNVGAGRL
jgi:hypothetical protein